MDEKQLDSILKDIQDLKQRVNALERGIFMKQPTGRNKEEITKLGNEVIDRK